MPTGVYVRTQYHRDRLSVSHLGVVHKDKMPLEIRQENQKKSRRAWQKNHKEQALALGRKYYHAHPDRVKTKMQKNRERGIKHLQWIRDYKERVGCKCGERDYRCLDFHHLNPQKKKRCLSQMHLYSLETIKKEVSKCEVMCANCHRKLVHPKILKEGSCH